MRTLLINAAEPEECRVALIDDGRLEGYRVERSGSVTLVGNVYRGRIVNMESSIGAAFVDIDCGRNAFLHVSDCVGVRPEDRTPIEEHVQLGEDVLVQVTRDSIGPKGPVLTANLSLPGRFLVLLPFSEGGGISRRIAEEDNRTKLRGIVRELEEQAGAGLIVRTAGAERTKRELSRDLKALTRLWESIRTRATDGSGPALLHAEADLAVRALRDMLDDEVEEIVLDDPVVLKRVEETLNAWQPELTGRLRLHDDPRPLFHAYDLELQIDRLGARRVRLPSGGTIVFDQTEALLAVDVNSGRTREEELEETARRTNLEAATEIARQLRLRDLGGVVAVDFIDMREDEHIREVESVFKAALKKDRARVRPARLGSFGIFVLTRRRAGPTEIGEDCGVKLHAVDPALLKRVRRYLDGGIPGPRIGKTRQQLVQFNARRRRHALGIGEFIDAAAERPDVSTLAVEETQALHNQIGDGGLAVGTSHTADFEPLRR